VRSGWGLLVGALVAWNYHRVDLWVGFLAACLLGVAAWNVGRAARQTWAWMRTGLGR